MKTEITNITLKLGNRKIELTPDEARKVYHELQNLFNLEQLPKEYIPYPVYPPIIIDRAPVCPNLPYPGWEITYCGTYDETNNNTAKLSISLT